MLRGLLPSALVIASLVFVSSSLGQEGAIAAKRVLGVADGRTLSPYLTALSRDGKQLAYRTSADTIDIFDPRTSKHLRTVTIQEKEIGELLFFSPDGTRLIFRAMQQFRLVDPTNGMVETTIGDVDRFDIYPHTFRWNADCSVLTDVQEKYDFGFKPPVKAWNVRERKVIGSFEVSQTGGERSEAISGDGRLIATTGRYHRKGKETDEDASEYVELWDSKTLARKSRIHLGKETYAVLLGLNADGSRLVTVVENAEGAILWDTATGKKVAAIGRSPASYGTITFSPDDKQFALQSYRGSTVVLETATGKKVAARDDQGRVPAGVGFTPEGDIVACFVEGNQVRVSLVNREVQPPTSKPVGHLQPAILTRFSPDGKTIFTVGLDDKVLRWETESGKLLETTFDESSQFRRNWDAASTFSSDDRFLVVSEGGRLTLFDLAKKQKVGDLKTGNEKYRTSFYRVDFSDDGKTIFARGEGQENRTDFQIVIVSYVAAWKTSDGIVVSEFLDPKRDQADSLFDMHYGKEKLQARPEQFQGAVEVVIGPSIRDPWASSRNAGPIEVGNQLTLRDRKTGKVLLDKILPLNNGRGISFSPDGKKLAVPLNDNTIPIFELP